jgi:murein DD-endopeptidase MepM/ murein hydrolase activator NlpD
MRHRKKKSPLGKIAKIAIFLAIGAFIITSPVFERQVPTVSSGKNVIWNKKEPLKTVFKDNKGLKHYKLTLSDGENNVIVGQGDFKDRAKKETIFLNYPHIKVLDEHAKSLTLKVEVTDTSLWSFFAGNTLEENINIDIDKKLPTVNVLSHSYSITQGGSALVVFQAEDENLDDLYIEAGAHLFSVQPYNKEGYFAALIAWPFNEDKFAANIVATDTAQNKRVVEVPLFLQPKQYKVSWIRAKDKFIDGKITDLIQSDPEYAHIDNRLDKLKAINETMRLKNEELIHGLAKNVSSELLTKWDIKKFYPLKNGQRVATYGDKRYYYYETKDNKVSQSYHVGHDLASTRMAAIKTSNAGTVVYAQSNGIYGKMPMIDHGLGLYSLYGHCSELLVGQDEKVEAEQSIAKTGVSGLALGDHLHFGLLVQGIEVRPVEWFDDGWIRGNIANIFKEADKLIEKN